MFNTFAEANELALSSGWNVLARACVSPLPWRLVIQVKGNIMWRKQIWGEWTRCTEQASIKQTSGRICICFLQCCRWLAFVKCDKALAALLVIIIIKPNNNNTVRKVWFRIFKDGFYLPFLNAAAVRDIHICTHSTSCQTAHTCFCDLFRFHWKNPQHYWQGCLCK